MQKITIDITIYNYCKNIVKIYIVLARKDATPVTNKLLN